LTWDAQHMVDASRLRPRLPALIACRAGAIPELALLPTKVIPFSVLENPIPDNDLAEQAGILR
jgi:hypothetical protein